MLKIKKKTENPVIFMKNSVKKILPGLLCLHISSCLSVNSVTLLKTQNNNQMRIVILFLLLLAFELNLFSQVDSVNRIAYNPDFKFKEGVFLNFEQVKNNLPIIKSRLLISVDYNDNEFFDVLFSKPVITYYDDYGMKQEVKLKSIWGYCKNSVLYVRMSDNFYRITYIGRISHFVANITVYQSSFNDPYYYNPYYYYRYWNEPRNYASTEMRQFIMDFDTGKIYDYSDESIEVLLMRDPELHDEYMGLRNKKKQQLKFFYIRKFNERNPLMMPVN
jgi:hypothetical protein